MRKEMDYYLDAYTMFMQKRKSPKDKNKFIDMNTNIFTNLGYDVVRERIGFDTDLVIGDISNSKYIVIASYDIPLKTMLPKFKHYVTDLSINKKYEIANYAMIVLSIMIVCIVAYAAKEYINSIMTHGLVFSIILSILILLIGYIVLLGNIHFFFSKDAALAVVYALADTENLQNVAFILADNSSVNYCGIRNFLEKHKYEIEDKKIIIIDNIGESEFCYYVTKNMSISLQNKTMGKDIKISNEKHNIMSYIKQGILVDKGFMHNQDIYISNMRNNKNLPTGTEPIIEVYEEIKKIIKK